jgi:hypothetical protein
VGNKHLVYITKNGVEIYVEPGSKSRYDFMVKYKEPGKRVRTPKHIHLIIDLYMKKSGNNDLTLKLVKEFLKWLNNLKESKEYPPSFQEFTKEKLNRFKDLSKFGEYSVEFLSAIFDLIMIQEKTNYPEGTINRKLFEAFLEGKDIFSVVSSASFRGRLN